MLLRRKHWNAAAIDNFVIVSPAPFFTYAFAAGVRSRGRQSNFEVKLL
jgi:hypothetical protein